MAPYKKLDASDKKYKSLILKWMAKQFNYPDYPHSFKDQFINWNIWDSELTIIFDSRQLEQMKLLSLIPPQMVGAVQYKSLLIVNKHTFNIRIEKLGAIEYPEINGYTLIKEVTQFDNDGDIFYEYNWEISLTDGTSIEYNNQDEYPNLNKGDIIYNSIIQERFFCNFLENKTY